MPRIYTTYLNTFMFCGMILGAGFGILFPELSLSTGIVGELFIRLLTVLVVPVIVLSMLSGIFNLKDSSSLARLGFKAVVFYSATTALAVLTGLILVHFTQPGVTNDPATHEAVKALTASSGESALHTQGTLADVLRNIIPKNVVGAAADGNVLGLIFLSVFFAVGVLQFPSEKTAPFRAGAQLLFETVIWMVEKTLLLAPIGFFSLIASLVGSFLLEGKLEALGESLVTYTGTVLFGLFFHGIVTLPLLARLFGVRPLRFAQAMLPALATAFSTASSAATLPITIDSLEHRAQISNRVASFVAPLGATVNMDGTAIYEAIAVVFIANMLGVELTFMQQVTVFLTATFSAVGAAGIPGAGLVMMVLVLHSVGLPADGVKLVVVVDRALDMVRTALNVWGDSIGAAIIDKSET
ncbi:MAG: dicarboxylate/amino acid:cation symporter [Bdellovibrionales bacterium]|nr:dicarboxylate/amino acid:cation symporter [Bdellovibrionales bacterium]